MRSVRTELAAAIGCALRATGANAQMGGGMACSGSFALLNVAGTHSCVNFTCRDADLVGFPLGDPAHQLRVIAHGPLELGSRLLKDVLRQGFDAFAGCGGEAAQLLGDLRRERNGQGVGHPANVDARLPQ